MRYVIALARAHRETAPPGLLDGITKQSGVALIGTIRFGRMLIECDERTIDEIRAAHGDTLDIEPEMTYRPSGKG